MRPTEKSPHTEALDALVRVRFGLSWGKARAWIRTGKVTVAAVTVIDPGACVPIDAVVDLRMNAPRVHRHVLAPNALVFVDSQVVVVRKPAGISTVPYEEDERGTLDELVRAALGKGRTGRPPLGIVHRLDTETSGLVVFTRTWQAKQSLSGQFRAHTVHRRYLALVHGAASKRTYRTYLVEDRGDGLRGSARRAGVGGKLAVTHVEPLESFAQATRVACTLETGRTHQIRIHLSEDSHPVVGERVYIRGLSLADLAAPRLMLHAAELGFMHPSTGEALRWADPLPDDIVSVQERLRTASP